ncbi:hypothetical protein ACJRO7_024109 [Eucalyptus globulus]|uniref:Sialate O-acetylesterase domain-containing protein n=1 Tax=Eucalyptus globulus TaxID=34317 RepID=A0ABD3K5B4_EUCGL
MLFFFLLFLTTTSTHSPSVHPQPLPPSPCQSPRPKSIFLLAGQSNMVGRGGVDPSIGWDGVVPPECSRNSSILRLTMKLKWVEAQEPLHIDIDTTAINGISLGMAFANAVMRQDRSLGLVGLVLCAIGGMKISQWERGMFLYNQFMRQARAGMNDGGTIKALLNRRHVEESDAVQYKVRLEKFFTDVRTDLQSPELPIFQVAIASGQRNFIHEVRKVQLGLDLPNVRTVDALGLPLKPDQLHLTTPAEVRLGQILADAFLQAVLSTKDSSSSV